MIYSVFSIFSILYSLMIYSVFAVERGRLRLLADFPTGAARQFNHSDYNLPLQHQQTDSHHHDISWSLWSMPVHKYKGGEVQGNVSEHEWQHFWVRRKTRPKAADFLVVESGSIVPPRSFCLQSHHLLLREWGERGLPNKLPYSQSRD